eukprot:jgi/Mesen1/1442/ME000132S00381
MARCLLPLFLCSLLKLQASSFSAHLSTTVMPPVTRPLQKGMRPFSDSLPIDSPQTSFTPHQIHISPAGPGSVFVHWASGPYQAGRGVLTPLSTEKVRSVVTHGYGPAALHLATEGQAEVYSQLYAASPADFQGQTALNYTSPLLHTVQLSGLQPGSTVYYQVGDGGQLASATAYPQRVAVVADWGTTSNSTSTLKHLLHSTLASAPLNPPLVYLVGDFAYADTFYDNGTGTNIPGVTASNGFEGLKSGSWQPVWDTWQHIIEPLSSQVPLLTCVGNHEIEQQSAGEHAFFTSVQARWKTPGEAGRKGASYFFYSHEAGPVHAIFLSVYHDYTPGSRQWQFLYDDLRSVDRTVTPWVTVSMHNPWYTTDAYSYKEFEQMRVSMEPLTHQFGVDIFLYGHVHAYERTLPVYDYAYDACGAVHLTVGDGGNQEGPSFLKNMTALNVANEGSMADLGKEGNEDTGRTIGEERGGKGGPDSSCRPGWLTPVAGAAGDPWAYFRRVFTYQGDGGSPAGLDTPGFCYKEQPMWSQYREPSFGHGVIDFLNDTHALWEWHANQDGVAVARDSVYIVRDPLLCPNKASHTHAQSYRTEGREQEHRGRYRRMLD